MSLFGLNSLDDLRHSIFEASVAPAKALTGPDIESVEELYEAGKALARRSRGFLGATFSMLGAGEVGKPREGIDVAFEDGTQAKNPAAHATLA